MGPLLSVIGLALALAVWLDVLNQPSWAWGGAAETRRWVWLLGSLFCIVVAMWWWFSQTRSEVRAYVRRNGGQRPPMNPI